MILHVVRLEFESPLSNHESLFYAINSLHKPHSYSPYGEASTDPLCQQAITKSIICSAKDSHVGYELTSPRQEPFGFITLNLVDASIIKLASC